MPFQEFIVATINELIERVKATITETDTDAVRALQTSDAPTVIIDVREREEFVDGHIEGAEFIPRGQLDLKIETAVPKRDTPIVLYCAGGNRSALAARSLEELGYTDVKSMAGGFTAWKRSGYPVHIPRAMTSEQLTRYSRHLVIPEIGEKGQRKLIDAKVLLLGAGALGSPVAMYLTAAGVGTIGIIDSDVVDRSNLQRQILHTDEAVGTPKVESAKARMKALNPDVEIHTHQTWLSSENVLDIFEGYDVVVDGGDNFATRYLVNDACVRLGIPNVHGSVYRFEGQATSFVPHQGPCYRCLYPEPPPPELAPSCQEAGVLGVIPGVIGMLQAIEVIKLIVGIGEPLAGRLLTFDGLKTQFRELKLRRDPECALCGENAEWNGFIDYEVFCNVS
ncbi:molybdopterin-synthase adenylyltransferase MoeB [Bradymonadaceae bacterium TMQ3]|uniref:Molybdopterin-synthase adenylyltransferase MoeB n=1 Tax=Lujinxingia sediminis TaxID=2480984 RepID=A0ABY0CXS3_9DELT|nr:molybdopterin-synthase adenylyltransferase MoeB [Bradymonadaceae bacterium TMQ3]RVU48697.1 molybdopterin-synthase adenylyltransferase MoeB [Lujinxingia sediminis]TXC77990.1 molybdopterin-synthase adenylyltransferase MoeB [Bradymonadales bacterium TMQ1]